jgi:TPR repeat protein
MRLLALVALAAFPRLACGASSREAPGVDPLAPAPSASVITIAAGMGFCEDLAICDRECSSGSSDRCRRLGVNYEFGHGVVVDGVHATALYEQACRMGNPDGCLAAGRMYEFHHGVTKDDAKAVALYTRACDMSFAAGCANLAIMLEAGRGIAKDEAMAGQLFSRACEQGSSLACEHARKLSAARHD